MSNELSLPHKNSKCIFCDEKHWSDDCSSFPDVLFRKRRLKKRCFISLKEGHLAEECKLQNKVCVHCGEKKKHHRNLRPKKFEITKTPGIERNENDENITPHEHNLVAVGEKIVIQTALATVKNTETLRSEKTRILMDTGSQRTYITKELADNLQLKTRETQEYSIYTLGSKKPKKVTTSLAELTIKTQKGNDILIKASIVPQITGLVQRIPINISEQQNLKKTYNLGDTLSQQVQTSTLGLLIGNDYYHELIMGERTQIQDGLYLIKSKLGWILSGRLSCSNSETVMENAMFIMT